MWIFDQVLVKLKNIKLVFVVSPHSDIIDHNKEESFQEEYKELPGFTLDLFSEVHVTRSLLLWACFVDRCLSFCTFYLSHCVVCSSSIYGFWLPLWYLQTLLAHQLSLLQFYLVIYRSVSINIGKSSYPNWKLLA